MIFSHEKRIKRLEEGLDLALHSIAHLQTVILMQGTEMKGRELKTPLDLLSKLFNTSLKKETPKAEPKKRNIKKHHRTKVCEGCGKAFKGELGLSIHRSRIHGIKGKWLQK